ncbi:hypothetical protein D3C72_1322490 [compost metagenome]
MLGLASTGQVQRGAVVYRGADEGQPQRDVHAVAEGAVFQRRQPLVMVHRQHAVGIAQVARLEQRVGRERAARIDAGILGLRQRGHDHVDLFAAHVPAFAGMGVQARDQDARARDAKVAAQVGIDDGQCLQQQRDGKRIRHRAQRQVGGGQRHAQHGAVVRGLRAGQHHHHARHAGAVGQVFGMAGEGDAGVVDGALLHRRRDHCGIPGRGLAARAAAADGGIEQLQHIGAVARIEPPGLARDRQRDVLDHHVAVGNAPLPGVRGAQRRGAFGQQTGIAQHMETVVSAAAVAAVIGAGELQQRPDGDIGADAGGFTGRDGQG